MEYRLVQRIRRLDAAALNPAAQETGVLIHAKGANGTLSLYEDRVRLTKSGWRAVIGVGYGAGMKDIALSQITAIQWRDSGTKVIGYVAFSFIGGADPSGGVFRSVRSENAVTFTKHQQPAFEAIRAEVQSRIGRANVAPSQATSSAQAIKELADLRGSGHITADEYEAKKTEILARI